MVVMGCLLGSLPSGHVHFRNKSKHLKLDVLLSQQRSHVLGFHASKTQDFSHRDTTGIFIV